MPYSWPGHLRHKRRPYWVAARGVVAAWIAGNPTSGAQDSQALDQGRLRLGGLFASEIRIGSLGNQWRQNPHPAQILPHRSNMLFGFLPWQSRRMRPYLYRQCALTCVRFASEASDTRTKFELLDMAQAWANSRTKLRRIATWSTK